ncbi:P-loop containing nucleoside triphosphate hydrolase protein [Paxillus ammoniavirescens]|nr:P-loop containing nucleoside triphosphate hydrolase protein [Paxillus ammoniavirescens]
MGAAVSTARGALVSGIIDILNSIRKACMRENPTLAIIKARAETEAAKAEAKWAREEVEAMRAEAKATGEAVEAEKRQVQEELQRQRAAHAEALRDARKMEVEWVVSAGMNNVKEVLAESRRAKESAEERARQVQRQAEEDRKVAKEAQGAAEAAAIEANERARAAKKAQKEAEERLKKGIQPVIMPSHEEVEAAKRKVQYIEDLFHFAVAGVAGGGKSSFINAFRGLRNLDIGAAPTGVTETTLAISRLPDPNEENPFVWYDIPGAGTMKIKDWQYFNDQGLYVFDCIIIVFDSRFTMTDVAILMNCKRFGIPTYIVRSKSDIHIRNIMLERGYNSDDDDSDRTWCKTLYTEAREQYIAETRANIKQNLEDANLPDQRVYMVSNGVLLSIVKNQNLPLKIIDELELMRDVCSEAYSRRCVPTLSPATLL